MPLTKTTVTAASRVMLPAYVVLATYLGLLYLIDPHHRLQRSPGLTFARLLMPMSGWGCVFLTLAGLMTAALVMHHRMLFVAVLYVYAAAAVMWAGIYLGAVFVNPDASLGGPAWPAFVATACFAPARSLLAQER